MGLTDTQALHLVGRARRNGPSRGQPKQATQGECQTYTVHCTVPSVLLPPTVLYGCLPHRWLSLWSHLVSQCCVVEQCGYCTVACGVLAEQVLHDFLEPCDERDKLAVVGLSNWALDYAKMNRCCVLSCAPPTTSELQHTAKTIFEAVTPCDEAGLPCKFTQALDCVCMAFVNYRKQQVQLDAAAVPIVALRSQHQLPSSVMLHCLAVATSLLTWLWVCCCTLYMYRKAFLIHTFTG